MWNNLVRILEALEHSNHLFLRSKICTLWVFGNKLLYGYITQSRIRILRLVKCNNYCIMYIYITITIKESNNKINKSGTNWLKVKEKKNWNVTVSTFYIFKSVGAH